MLDLDDTTCVNLFIIAFEGSGKEKSWRDEYWTGLTDFMFFKMSPLFAAFVCPGIIGLYA